MSTRDRDSWMDYGTTTDESGSDGDMPRSRQARDEVRAALSGIVRGRVSNDPATFNRNVRQTGGQ